MATIKKGTTAQLVRSLRIQAERDRLHNDLVIAAREVVRYFGVGEGTDPRNVLVPLRDALRRLDSLPPR